MKDIVGTVQDDGVQAYLGIPYAKAKRFASPEAYTIPYPSFGLNATEYGSECIQLLPSLTKSNKSSTPMGNATSNFVGSEDCLFLNVWVPSPFMEKTPETSSLLPTMVFIHGGAWIEGSGADVPGGINDPISHARWCLFTNSSTLSVFLSICLSIYFFRLFVPFILVCV